MHDLEFLFNIMFCSLCNTECVVVARGGVQTKKTFHCGINGYLGSYYMMTTLLLCITTGNSCSSLQ